MKGEDMKKIILVSIVASLFSVICFADDYGKCLRVFYKKADKSIIWTHEIIDVKGGQPKFSIGSEIEQLEKLPNAKPDGKTALGGTPSDYGYCDILDTQTVNDYRNCKSKHIDANGVLHIEKYTQAELDAIETQKKAEAEREGKIRDEVQRITRGQAIQNLIDSGDIENEDIQ